MYQVDRKNAPAGVLAGLLLLSHAFGYLLFSKKEKRSEKHTRAKPATVHRILRVAPCVF